MPKSKVRNKKKNIMQKLLRLKRKKSRSELIKERQGRAIKLLNTIAYLYEQLKNTRIPREFSEEIEALHQEKAEQDLAIISMERQVSELYMSEEVKILDKLFKGKWIYDPRLGKTKRFLEFDLEEIL